MHHLRSLSPDDLPQVVAVYRDAVITQAAAFYAPQQIRAWSEHAACDRGVQEALERGYGLASCSVRSPGIIEAFALLDPLDRLALLYCRGRSCRQGHASGLLEAVETVARHQGCRQLRTEASQLSRPLLQRRGWSVTQAETVIFAGERFRRWQMIKPLVGENGPHGSHG